MGGGVGARAAVGRQEKRGSSFCQHRDRTRQRALLEGAFSVPSCGVGNLPLSLFLCLMSRVVSSFRRGSRCGVYARHSTTTRSRLYLPTATACRSCANRPRGWSSTRVTRLILWTLSTWSRPPRLGTCLTKLRKLVPASTADGHRHDVCHDGCSSMSW